MSLLPSFVLDDDLEEEEALENEDEEFDNPKEFEIDYQTGELTGNIVEGLEAIKVWIWMALHTERYRYPTYTWDYGVELEQFIGKGYSKEYVLTASKEAVEEALTINEHIQEVGDFKANFDGDKLKLNFTVVTDLGEVEISV